MTKIIIAGAGFGGLTAALGLEKSLGRRRDVSIILIDRHDYQLFNPALYEVAAAEEEMTSLRQLKHSVALPLRKILAGKKIQFIQSEIAAIDRAQRKIQLATRSLEYDYLVLALGSKPEYFGISGAAEHSLPLKSLKDAFRIRNALEFAVQAHKNDAIKQYVRFVVAGGGYSGVELAAELAELRNILAWKNNYPREKIEIVIVEAANQLVPGFDARASRDIYKRLSSLGVSTKLLSPIFKVESNAAVLATGERLVFDALIWTAGVRAQDCSLAGGGDRNKRGQFETDGFLRLANDHRVFALGDIACIHGASQSVAPTTAQAAVAEAKYLVKALPILMENKQPARYEPRGNPFVVAVGGRWTIFRSEKFYLTGYLAYYLRLGAAWRYFASVLGWWKATKLVWFEEEIFGRND